MMKLVTGFSIGTAIAHHQWIWVPIALLLWAVEEYAKNRRAKADAARSPQQRVDHE